MTVRTYFWEDRIISGFQFRARRSLGLSPYNFFRVGNAGDIIARDLIEHRYSCPVVNVRHGGKRLLVVGSTADRIQEGDVVCGIGVKTPEIQKAGRTPVQVRGVRGPISYDILKAAGHDVSNVKFQLDPGLLIRFRIEEAERRILPRGVIFIPHYRERGLYQKGLRQPIRLVDIDSRPSDVARAILEAELVYTSSLHGIIFSHALGRPCVMVAPQTHEPLLKYQDYFSAVNIPMPAPLGSIDEADFSRAPTSPADVRYEEPDFIWPEWDELREWGLTAP